MGTRPIGTGQDERGIPELRGTLENWRYLMGQRGWGSRDAPWWYNERASLSLLAGALWYADGWAFEEFVTSKRHKRKARRGRGDLMFEVGGLKAVAEAKQFWPALRTTPRSAMSVIARALDRACEESTRQRLRGYRSVGIVFVAPYIRSRLLTEREDRIRRLLRELNKVRGVAFAWAFPGDQRKLKSSEGWYYPGIVVMLKVASTQSSGV